MEAQMTPIIPIKQVLVSFAGHEFLAVQLPDGRIAVVLRHFCEALDLNFVGQIQRIQANPTLSKNFLLVRIKTPGGPQVVNALVTSVLSLWLGGFRLGRLSEEKRALIELLQTEAADAFNGHFYKVDTQTPPQQQAQASQPPQPPLPQPDAASLSVSELFQVVGARITQEMQHMRARLTTVEQEQRVLADQHAEAQRQLQALQAEVMALQAARKDSPPVADAPLSAEHEETLYVLLPTFRKSGCYILNIYVCPGIAWPGTHELEPSRISYQTWFMRDLKQVIMRALDTEKAGIALQSRPILPCNLSCCIVRKRTDTDKFKI